jgi:ferritin-like metal-binding protein YciE
MLVDQLRDAHSAERQFIQAMKRLLKKAPEPWLREGLDAHVAQSEGQRERVEQALGKVGRWLVPDGKHASDHAAATGA